jgi:hypothetical protein
MDPRAIPAHAETVRSVLALLGPRPRKRILLMLQGLGLSEAEAADVVTHAIDHGRVEPDPADATVLRVL